MTTTISQKSAREMLGNPEQLRGGVYINKNGTTELFVQTADEREAELAERQLHMETAAMLKLVGLSQRDYEEGHYSSGRDALARRRAAE